MFKWWRRRNEGFEWREYVRTTIKVRREDRARRIEEIKYAAAEGAKAAGRKSVETSRSGIARLWYGLAQGCMWIGRKSLQLGKWSTEGFVALLSHVASRAAIALKALSSIQVGNFGRWFRSISAATKIAAMFGGLGLLAGLSAFLQFLQSGAAWSTLLAGLVAVVLFGLAVVPLFRRLWHRQTLPRFNFTFAAIKFRPSVPAMPAVASIAGLMLLVGAAGYWGWKSGGLASMSTTVASALPSVNLGGGIPDIAGRGHAVSGDTIRIGGRYIRLAGIEAPEISQVCRDSRNRAWRCGQRARSALRRLMRRVHVVCRDVSRADAGRFQATCVVGNKNLAQEMVSNGYAFAQGMIFKTYADAETKARAEKAGVWQGKAQRPAEFRATRWEVARKSAPEGCPIKGQIVRRSKIYVVPWALEYRQVRVKPKRGGRWFCSEEEAAAAGFKPSTTS